jgi:hypothetical protein
MAANLGKAALGIGLAACVVTADAQTPVFRGGVETVEVTVTVTDGTGRLVTGLARDDFVIYEDGERQAITHFTDEEHHRPERRLHGGDSGHPRPCAGGPAAGL